jgi:hypothetical protein
MSGDALAGPVISPTLKPDSVGPDELNQATAYCSFSSSGGNPTGFCSGSNHSRTSTRVAPGTYCFSIPITPIAVVATVDSASAGFPEVFSSTKITTVDGNCGTGFKAVVVTYNHDNDTAGSTPTDEGFTAFIY